MKSKLLIFICVVIMSVICSCEQGKPPRQPTYEKITSSEMENSVIETGTVPGDYIYNVTKFNSYTLLMKYHIPTGTASTVCQDPFCTHNTMTCPFAIPASNMASIGNVLYFSNRIDDQTHIRSYNGDDMKLEEIYVSNGVLSKLFTYNYYLYFTEKLPTNVEEEYKTTIYRLDTQSGRFDTIDCGHPFATIYAVRDSEIIWKDGNKYFSTDLDGDCEDVYEINYCRQWGNYRYSWEFSDGNYKKMTRKDLTTKEEILIFEEDVYSFFFYGDKILYLKPVENPEVWHSDTTGDFYDTLGGNVYVMNLDGSDKRLLCHVEDCVILSTSMYRNNELCCGDWIGLYTNHFYESPTGPELTDTDLLLVNIVTGEYKHIKYNPYE